MKTCNRCKESKPLSEFNKKRASGVQPLCRPCQREYQVENYENTREAYLDLAYKNRAARKHTLRIFLGEYLTTHPCVDCGEDNILVLEFDHVMDKLVTISSILKNVSSLEVLKTEIAKCEVRCANCHRKITAKNGDNWRWRYLHGTDLTEGKKRNVGRYDDSE